MIRDFERGLTVERLRELFTYNKETGHFTFNKARGAKKAGSVAGTKNQYIMICIDYYIYCAHRLAWLYETGYWPSEEIDHKNLNKHDNRWENLREATRSENHANMTLTCANKSGSKGVFWHKERQIWQCWIEKDSKHYYIGAFTSRDEASAAYHAKAKELFGEYARVM